MKSYAYHSPIYVVHPILFLNESNNFLFSKIFDQNPDIGVNYVTPVSAFVEAYREVRGGLFLNDHLEETPIAPPKSSITVLHVFVAFM